MKTGHARRRKLHFSSAKDVAPVITVKVERPVKRRKRQPRLRRVSPTSTRRGNSLSATTWSGIQEQFAAAKSLGEITRIVLYFFTEHETLQGSSSGPVFPIFVPSSEIYRMKVPRKRRIYDVLHVLEGIGVIKRVRYDERRKTNGGYFLYYGKKSVVQHLAEMKNRSSQVMADFKQSHRLRSGNIVEEDSALVRAFENQAAADKWPCLVTMTVCFLGLLFQQDYKTGVGLPAISARLVEAKTLIGSLAPNLSTEIPYRDVHRRVYDVVSVLVSCNMVDTSPVPSSESMDRGLRKYVRFNYDIFTNPRILFATIDSVKRWNAEIECDSMSKDMVACFSDLESPNAEGLVYHWNSPSLDYWQSLHDDLALANLAVFSPIPLHTCDTSRMTHSSMKDDPASFRSVTDSLLPSDLRVILRPAKQPSRRDHKFYSPLGRMPKERNKWDEESFKHLGLCDELPAENKIDWMPGIQRQEDCQEIWGLQYTETASKEICGKPQEYRFDGMEVKLADLECREILDSDDVDNISSFFC